MQFFLQAQREATKAEKRTIVAWLPHDLSQGAGSSMQDLPRGWPSAECYTINRSPISSSDKRERLKSEDSYLHFYWLIVLFCFLILTEVLYPKEKCMCYKYSAQQNLMKLNLPLTLAPDQETEYYPHRRCLFQASSGQSPQYS